MYISPLQASMMQRVTNMELLKLSYWNPAKDMQSVLVDIKTFLQQWARQVTTTLFKEICLSNII